MYRSAGDAMAEKMIDYEQLNRDRVDMRARRRRRVNRETKNFEELARVLADHEIEAVFHDEQHWSFLNRKKAGKNPTGPQGGIADWWPSSGKFVFNRQWRRAKKATNIAQVWILLRDRWLR